MDVKAIAQYLYDQEKSISMLSDLNGTPVVFERISPYLMVLIGDTYAHRAMLKTSGFAWNPVLKMWEIDTDKNVLVLPIYTEATAYVALATNLCAIIRMDDSVNKDAQYDKIQLSLKYTLQDIKDFDVNAEYD